MADFVVVPLNGHPGVVNLDAIEAYNARTGLLKLPRRDAVRVSPEAREALLETLRHDRVRADVADFVVFDASEGDVAIPAENITHYLAGRLYHVPPLQATGWQCTVPFDDVVQVLGARPLAGIEPADPDLDLDL